MVKKLLIANPRGFCAGVDRAIKIIDELLIKYKGENIYVNHEIVHNKHVIENFKKKGVIFGKLPNDVPKNSIYVLSAHGTCPEIKKNAEARNMKIFDATCPLVKKIHLEVKKISDNLANCIYIGHAKHPESIGTKGYYNDGKQAKFHIIENENDIDKLNIDSNIPSYYTTQTTLSIDDTNKIIAKLTKKHSNIIGPKKDDICYATQNRQNALKQMLNKVDMVLIIGSSHSSNTNRLKDIAIAKKPAYMIENYSEIKAEWFDGKNTVGLTAGASAPDILVQKVISYLKKHYVNLSIEETQFTQEKVKFSLPKNL